MQIGIVTPAPAGSTYGNRITATRWASILKRLGHQVSISQAYKDQALDVLIALHARRSYQSIKRFHRKRPTLPIVVTLTGTDVYQDLARDERTAQSLEWATRIVALQPKALHRLKPNLRAKALVVFQSVENRKRPKRKHRVGDVFVVTVIGHLRQVKDPFRAAQAARLLPNVSRIRIVQVGAAMTTAMAQRAQIEERNNSRYQWLGEVSRSRALTVLSKSDCCVVSSRMEGGANVMSEAIVAGVPVLASRIDGNTGILGVDYPGLFNVGDTKGLARLLREVETNERFRENLHRRVKALAPLFEPKREERAWAELIDGLRPGLTPAVKTNRLVSGFVWSKVS